MLRVAAVQMKMGPDRKSNVDAALAWVAKAAAQGAKLIVLPELFESEYFPQTEEEEYFSWAQEVSPSHSFLHRFQELAKKEQVFLPVSLFERDAHSYYNSLVLINSAGEFSGVYRKAHIPDGPSYEEKFYFAPGNTAIKPWHTSLGSIGFGICWDQWFPEVARLQSIAGAEVLLYPTAIGTEPPAAGWLDTRRMWRSAMIGHAVCNGVPVIAANRVGQEAGMNFYGNSFICDPYGTLLDAEDSPGERLLLADLDLAAYRRHRAAMGFFRDRRPDLYGALLTREGEK
jgi:N-carbamoylputrescine amidase